jgi:hypothetical protein
MDILQMLKSNDFLTLVFNFTMALPDGEQWWLWCMLICLSFSVIATLIIERVVTR